MLRRKFFKLMASAGAAVATARVTTAPITVSAATIPVPPPGPVAELARPFVRFLDKAGRALAEVPVVFQPARDGVMIGEHGSDTAAECGVVERAELVTADGVTFMGLSVSAFDDPEPGDLLMNCLSLGAGDTVSLSSIMLTLPRDGGAAMFGPLLPRHAASLTEIDPCVGR